MKKEIVAILFLTAIFISLPFISAQTYSNFNRFTDNVRLFFSGGDNKVRLALEIKEKEVNSALENVQALNNEDADKNLQQAWKKLQLIQEKVTIKNLCPPINISGWVLKDESRKEYKFNTILNNQITLYSTIGTDNNNILHWNSKTNVWNDDRDSLYLFDSNNNLAHYNFYGY